MLYPQNGGRIVTVDSVTSLHSMYRELSWIWVEIILPSPIGGVGKGRRCDVIKWAWRRRPITDERVSLDDLSLKTSQPRSRARALQTTTVRLVKTISGRNLARRPVDSNHRSNSVDRRTPQFHEDIWRNFNMCY